MDKDNRWKASNGAADIHINVARYRSSATVYPALFISIGARVCHCLHASALSYLSPVVTQIEPVSHVRSNRVCCVLGRVRVCAFASLSLLGTTCVPDVHYQDLSPYWDLI